MIKIYRPSKNLGCLGFRIGKKVYFDFSSDFPWTLRFFGRFGTVVVRWGLPRFFLTVETYKFYFRFSPWAPTSRKLVWRTWE